jgi:hypothetical protein
MFGKKSTEHAPPAVVPGRNEPCHCGSGKKYKKCHEDKDATARHQIIEKRWTEGEKEAAKKAEEEKKAAPEQFNTPTKPIHQPHVSDHRRNTMTVPKFNMPRKTGGG